MTKLIMLLLMVFMITPVCGAPSPEVGVGYNLRWDFNISKLDKSHNFNPAEWEKTIKKQNIQNRQKTQTLDPWLVTKQSVAGVMLGSISTYAVLVAAIASCGPANNICITAIFAPFVFPVASAAGIYWVGKRDNRKGKFEETRAESYTGFYQGLLLTALTAKFLTTNIYVNSGIFMTSTIGRGIYGYDKSHRAALPNAQSPMINIINFRF